MADPLMLFLERIYFPEWRYSPVNISGEFFQWCFDQSFAKSDQGCDLRF